MHKDGWPAELPVTNDVEDYFGNTFSDFPALVVVNLKTMEVKTASAGSFGANGYDHVDDLIETISKF